MKWFSITILYFIAAVEYSYQISTPDSSNYVAGVVEFARQNIDNVAENTKRFVDIIKSDETKEVDILVFPEAVLTKVDAAVSVPRAEDKIVPCANKSHEGLLNDISCAAKESAKYVVINIYMQRDCKAEAAATNDTRPCSLPDKNINIYNTNVAFDRSGQVVAVYRKYHLYGEPGVRAPLTTEQVTFDTDFGVKFGLFTCFDISFEYPALGLVRNNVKNFIFTSLWYNELPFLTANQVQQNFAFAQNVNLLAANGNRPNESITGSGIYSGSIGALTSFVSETITTRVLTATVPKNPGAQRPTQTRDLNRDKPLIEMDLWKQDLSKFTVKMLDFSQNTTQTGELCHNEQCCDYAIEVIDHNQPKEQPSYYYAVIAFKGQRTYAGVDNFYAGITACSLVACTGNDQNSCAKRFRRSEPTPVERYKIKKAKFITVYKEEPASPYAVEPNTLSTAAISFSPSEFTYTLRKYSKQNVNYNEVTIELARPKSDILTFGIYGRDFSLDAYTSARKAVNDSMLVALGVA